MILNNALLGRALVVLTAGMAVGMNLIIAGLIVIAVVHDGTTSAQVAATFQAILTDGIAAIGPVVGGLITGGAVIVHNQLSQNRQNGSNQP